MIVLLAAGFVTFLTLRPDDHNAAADTRGTSAGAKRVTGSATVPTPWDDTPPINIKSGLDLIPPADAERTPFTDPATKLSFALYGTPDDEARLPACLGTGCPAGLLLWHDWSSKTHYYFEHVQIVPNHPGYTVDSVLRMEDAQDRTDVFEAVRPITIDGHTGLQALRKRLAAGQRDLVASIAVVPLEDGFLRLWSESLRVPEGGAPSLEPLADTVDIP